MEETHSLAELARYRRDSLSSIRLNAAALVVAGLALWVLSRIIHVPRWLTIIVIGMAVFYLVGNAYNVLYINAQIHRRAGRRLRRNEQDS